MWPFKRNETGQKNSEEYTREKSILALKPKVDKAIKDGKNPDQIRAFLKSKKVHPEIIEGVLADYTPKTKISTQISYTNPSKTRQVSAAAPSKSVSEKDAETRQETRSKIQEARKNENWIVFSISYQNANNEFFTEHYGSVNEFKNRYEQVRGNGLTGAGIYSISQKEEYNLILDVVYRNLEGLENVVGS
ncbi:MAG: hypothetical protein ABIH72_01310 [archaeon]